MTGVSVVFPIFLPTAKHKEMTDKCIYLAKANTNIDAKWVIVETCSKHYEHEADIYIHEEVKTTPNKSINRGFGAADTEFVIFLANDVFVGEGWIESLLECFEKKDCGMATLGTTEYGCTKTGEIIERIYFSVCMVRKSDAWFDPAYDNLFDDSDLIMRIYANGKKCYMNLGCIVDHLRHKTYGPPNLSDPKNIKQREYFQKKWEAHKDSPIYKLFA